MHTRQSIPLFFIIPLRPRTAAGGKRAACDVTQYSVQAASQVQTSRPANLLALHCCVASAIWYYDGTTLIEFLLRQSRLMESVISWLLIGNACDVEISWPPPPPLQNLINPATASSR